MPEAESLLDPEFVRELEALVRRLEIRARSGALGERAAKRRGGAAEFHEHRSYEPGDDLRRVDWLAYARTGAPVVKLFRAEEDAVVRLLLDASESLAFGDPAKIEVARRLGAAFGFMALSGGQRAQVLVAAERQSASSALAQISPPRRGRSGLSALLRDLSQRAPSGRADLSRAVGDAILRSRRPGMLVVLSDFFDPSPVTEALSRARAAGHDVALVQIVARSEIEPTLEGDYALLDSETGAVVDVSVDPRALEAYALRFAGLVEELGSWARRHGASYVLAPTDEPLEGVVRRFVARGVD